MRKINILQENFMALEQQLAEAIDSAEGKIESTVGQTQDALDQMCSQIQDDQNFHQHPIFINWKNESNLEQGLEKLDGDLSSVASKLKDMDSTSLGMSALLSKILTALTGGSEEPEDEVAEVVQFFGGKENTDIPESKDTSFTVVISDSGKGQAIQNMIAIRELFESIKEKIHDIIENGQDKLGFMQAMRKFAVLKDLTQSVLGQ
jgi:hypothetical protein